jgi:hypothetical protein
MLRRSSRKQTSAMAARPHASASSGELASLPSPASALAARWWRRVASLSASPHFAAEEFDWRRLAEQPRARTSIYRQLAGERAK